MAILSCHVSIKLPPKISDGQKISYPLHRYHCELGLTRVKINRVRLYMANGSSATRLAESRMSRCGPEDSESSDGEGTRPWPGDREQYSVLPFLSARPV